MGINKIDAVHDTNQGRAFTRTAGPVFNGLLVETSGDFSFDFDAQNALLTPSNSGWQMGATVMPTNTGVVYFNESLHGGSLKEVVLANSSTSIPVYYGINATGSRLIGNADGLIPPAASVTVGGPIHTVWMLGGGVGALGTATGPHYVNIHTI